MFISIESNHKETSIESHYAIQILAKKLDLKHNCGYITMMRTSQSHVKKPSRNMSFNTKKLQEDVSSHSTNSSGDKDVEKNNSSNNLALNFNENNASCKTEPFQESDWLLLDCSFGIPLFEGSLNKKVCERLLDEKLCNSLRYVYILNTMLKFDISCNSVFLISILSGLVFFLMQHCI